MADGEPPLLEHPSLMATKLATSAVSRPSYAAVLQNKKQNEDAKDPISSNLVQLEDVSFKPVSQYQGKLAVIFPILEKSMLVEKLKYVLVGKFSHGRPPWSKIREFFVDLKLNGTFNISVFDHKHIYIECSNQIDYNRIWLRLNWKVDGCSMRILKWVPQFTPAIESPIVPVWIRLEGIPLYMFEEMPLLQISKAIGKPIKIDARNLNRSMLNIARVCVELDISKTLIDSFWVCFEDNEKGVVKEPLEVEVFYDSLPDYCSICSHIGHKMEDCKRKISTGKVQDVSQSNVERNKVIKTMPAQIQKVTKTWMVVTTESGILDKGKGIMQVEAEPSNEDGTSSTMVGEVQLVDEPKTVAKDAAICEIQGTALCQIKQLQQVLVKDGAKTCTSVDNRFSILEEQIIQENMPFVAEEKAAYDMQMVVQHNPLQTATDCQKKSLVVHNVNEHEQVEVNRVDTQDNNRSTEVNDTEFQLECVTQKIDAETVDTGNLAKATDHYTAASLSLNSSLSPAQDAELQKSYQPNIMAIPLSPSRNNFVKEQSIESDGEGGKNQYARQCIQQGKTASKVTTKPHSDLAKSVEQSSVPLEKDMPAIVVADPHRQVISEQNASLKNDQMADGDISRVKIVQMDDNNAEQVVSIVAEPAAVTHEEMQECYTPDLKHHKTRDEISDSTAQEWHVVGKNNKKVRGDVTKSQGVVTRSQSQASHDTWANLVEEEHHFQPKTKAQPSHTAKLSKKQLERKMCKLGSRLNNIGDTHKMRSQLQEEMDSLQEEYALLR